MVDKKYRKGEVFLKQNRERRERKDFIKTGILLFLVGASLYLYYVLIISLTKFK